jgi:hypothetical protein
MFEIKEKSKLKVSIYGREFELAKPTYGQSQNLQVRLKDEGQEKSMQIMKEFVIGLGLPEDCINEMELDHFLQLIEHISGVKKN